MRRRLFEYHHVTSRMQPYKTLKSYNICVKEKDLLWPAISISSKTDLNSSHAKIPCSKMWSASILLDAICTRLSVFLGLIIIVRQHEYEGRA